MCCPRGQGNIVFWIPQWCPGTPLHQDILHLLGKSQFCPALECGFPQVVAAAGDGFHRPDSPGNVPAPIPSSTPHLPPAAGSGDSLGLSCFSSRPAIVGVWSAFVGPRSGRSKVLLKAGLLCSHGRTHGIPTQGMCLVYLADVLPEQMGKGNDSLSHFCLHCTLAHPSFSHLLSLGQQRLH